MNDLPSAADLDQVAEEDRIRIATKRTERCPCCGSVLDSPHKSDDEAILDCYQCTHNLADELNCVKCGQSAVGTALDGKPYCHRKTCIDWKAVRLAASRLASR